MPVTRKPTTFVPPASLRMRPVKARRFTTAEVTLSDGRTLDQEAQDLRTTDPARFENLR